MATASKTPAAAAAAVLLLLIAAAAVAPASASSLTLYRRVGCAVPVRGRCGVCYSIGTGARFYKGYIFRYFGGQVARLYDGLGCQGGSVIVSSSVGRCYSPYIFNSIRWIC